MVDDPSLSRDCSFALSSFRTGIVYIFPTCGKNACHSTAEGRLKGIGHTNFEEQLAT
jgi:hypothetical protein